MLVQKLIIKAVASLIRKQFKLDKILKYVEEPNELDEEVKQLKNRVDMLEIILKKEK
jgi:nicotinic acid mononucleotide adenylyltransferase